MSFSAAGGSCPTAGHLAGMCVCSWVPQFIGRVLAAEMQGVFSFFSSVNVLRCKPWQLQQRGRWLLHPSQLYLPPNIFQLKQQWELHSVKGLNWVSISCSALCSPMGLATVCLVGCCCGGCSHMGDSNLKDLWVSKRKKMHSCDASLMQIQVLQQQHGKWGG